MKSIKNNKGFTLTEIVVVIAIIGVLAVALVPKLNSFLGKADRVGAITDFQSSFANVVRAEMIEKDQLPSAGRLKSELEYQFTYHDGKGSEVASGLLKDIFKQATATVFDGTDTDKVITPMSAEEMAKCRVAYLKDDSTKKYMIIYKYKDATEAADDKFETAQVNAVTFVALSTSDAHSIIFEKNNAAKTRDIISETNSWDVIRAKLESAPNTSAPTPAP